MTTADALVLVILHVLAPSVAVFGTAWRMSVVLEQEIAEPIAPAPHRR
jgi:hypothetical protein